MEIHCIVVAHSLADDLVRLFNSVDEPVHWHLFRHSDYEDVRKACEELAARPRVTYYDYAQNRGLSRSWNEGMFNAWQAGADVVMIANDDAVMGYGDVRRIAEKTLAEPELYTVGGAGFDLREMRHMPDMRLSMASISRIAIETIGYFDENFYPIYFEDADYYRRAELAGLKCGIADGCSIIHAGSKTIHSNEALMNQHHVTFAGNRDYYLRKWGGLVGEERFPTPFDAGFSLYIAYEDRERPYSDYDRIDNLSITI